MLKVRLVEAQERLQLYESPQQHPQQPSQQPGSPPLIDLDTPLISLTPHESEESCLATPPSTDGGNVQKEKVMSIYMCIPCVSTKGIYML